MLLPSSAALKFAVEHGSTKVLIDGDWNLVASGKWGRYSGSIVQRVSVAAATGARITVQRRDAVDRPLVRAT